MSGLRLSDLNKETIYLLTYLLQPCTVRDSSMTLTQFCTFLNTVLLYRAYVTV